MGNKNEKKGPLQNEAIKTSEIWSPKGFPNLARCFTLNLCEKKKSKTSIGYMSTTVNWYLL